MLFINLFGKVKLGYILVTYWRMNFISFLFFFFLNFSIFFPFFNFNSIHRFSCCIIGIILPFFYAGNMNRDAQIYWIIDIIISMAMTAIIFQPIQAAFCKFFDFYFDFFFFSTKSNIF